MTATDIKSSGRPDPQGECNANSIVSYNLISENISLTLWFSAYELYCDPESDKPSRTKTPTGSSTPSQAKRTLFGRFKRFLCRDNKEETAMTNEEAIEVSKKNQHGAAFQEYIFTARRTCSFCWSLVCIACTYWCVSLIEANLRDTVSSIGIVRGKKMIPGTIDGMEHVCYFRHALALDERRVKFLPEYAYGGTSQPKTSPQDDHATNAQPGSVPKELDNLTPSGPEKRPQTLEVWFAGTHSDM